MSSKRSLYSLRKSNFPENDSSSDESCNFSINSDSDIELNCKRLKTSFDDDRNSQQSKNCSRRPTRLPDPNTSNRNALMARENRRRKKEYVGKLETELEASKAMSKSLQKMLKKQTKLIEKLQSEQRYYRNIFKNKNQIFQILNAVRSIPTPETSPSYSYSDSGKVEDGENGTVKTTVSRNKDPFLTETINDFYFTEFTQDLLLQNSWDNLLSSTDSLFPSYPEFTNETTDDKFLEIQSNISDEHNYTNFENKFSPNNLKLDDTAAGGICVHIAGKEITLEFCPNCSESSQNRKTGMHDDVELDVVNM